MEMKQKTPQFPFYYRDFLHAVRHMDKLEAWDYLLLLFEQADSSNGSIPEKIFDKLCTSENIREKFEFDENGYFNLRMRDVLHKRDSFKKSRLNNLSKKKSTHMGTHKGNHVDNDIDKDKDKDKRSNKVFTQPVVYPFDDELFVNRWQVWKDYKEEQFGFKYKPRGEQAALKSLGGISGNNMRKAIAIIEQSMANGWKGLFELKNGVDAETSKKAFDMADEIMRKHGL